MKLLNTAEPRQSPTIIPVDNSHENSFPLAQKVEKKQKWAEMNDKQKLKFFRESESIWIETKKTIQSARILLMHQVLMAWFF